MSNSHAKNFAGVTSSQYSKDAYIPVSEYNQFPRYEMGKNTSSIFLSDPKLMEMIVSLEKCLDELRKRFERQSREKNKNKRTISAINFHCLP